MTKEILVTQESLKGEENKIYCSLYLFALRLSELGFPVSNYTYEYRKDGVPEDLSDRTINISFSKEKGFCCEGGGPIKKIINILDLENIKTIRVYLKTINNRLSKFIDTNISID